MRKHGKYSIHPDAKFGFLELIDVPGLVAECKERWHNQTLCQVDDSLIRLGILEGEFHWHEHDREDEFFFILQGELLIDVGADTIRLARHQGYAVPKGMRHRTRSPKRSVVLMVERSSVQPTGD